MMFSESPVSRACPHEPGAVRIVPPPIALSVIPQLIPAVDEQAPCFVFTLGNSTVNKIKLE